MLVYQLCTEVSQWKLLTSSVCVGLSPESLCSRPWPAVWPPVVVRTGSILPNAPKAGSTALGMMLDAG